MQQYWAQAHALRFLLNKQALLQQCLALQPGLVDCSEQFVIELGDWVDPMDAWHMPGMPGVYRLCLSCRGDDWHIALTVAEIVAIHVGIVRRPRSSIEVFSVCVDPDWQGRGIMKQCLSYLLSVLSRVFGTMPVNAHIMHPATARYFAPSTICCHEQWQDVSVSLPVQNLLGFHVSRVGGGYV